MRAWLLRGAAAARLAADNGELWVPGAVAWLPFAGWLPFWLAVVPFPDQGDLVFFGADLVTSGAWPLNAILLGTVLAGLALLASLLAGLGEAALLRLTRSLTGGGQSRHSLPAEAARIVAVRLVAIVPAVVAAGLLLVGVAGVAPAEFQSPDIGGSVYARIAGRLAPFAVALLLTAIVGGAFGAVAMRRAVGPRAVPLPEALAAAGRSLARQPLRLTGVAVATLVLTTGYLVTAYLLLRVLWAPIGAALAAGRPAEAGTPLLLVGFMAIWLSLILGGGALHATASAWWSLEIAAGEGRPDEPSPAREDPEPA